MQNFRLLVTISLLQSSTIFGAIGIDRNLTDFLQHRQKRSWLIWQGSGNIKLSVSSDLAVVLGDPVAWRSCSLSYTFQGGTYNLPTDPLYPWDKWEHTFARSLQREREEFERTGQYKIDNSRLFAYKALEKYMDRQNVNGKECLLRSICENAQADEHLGLFAEIVNILLTPGHAIVDEVYKEAHSAGKSGVDCFKLYEKCPTGANLFDQFVEKL